MSGRRTTLRGAITATCAVIGTGLGPSSMSQVLAIQQTLYKNLMSRRSVFF